MMGHRPPAAAGARRSTVSAPQLPLGFGVWGLGCSALPSWTRGEAAVGGRCSPTGTASSSGRAWWLFLKLFYF